MKNNMILYIAACDKDGGIYAYKPDENFNLSLISKTDCDSPMYLAENCVRNVHTFTM